MSVSVTSAKVWANITAGWTDISSSLIGGMSSFRGMNDPKDNVADTGTLSFMLNSSSGTYTPGNVSCTAGWGKGTEIKYVIIYDGTPFTRFKGIVDTIDIQLIRPNVIVAKVTAVDWMNQAAEHPIVIPALQTDKTADEAIDLIIANMPIRPAAKDFDAGASTFPSVFDVTKEESAAMTEFAKLVNSELGYLYLQAESNSGERLVFENAYHRNGLLNFDYIPLPSSECSYMLSEDGGTVLSEDGGTVLVNETEQVVFSDVFSEFEVGYGDNIANHFNLRVYPRNLDTSATVLYTLGSAREIGAGEIFEFVASYSDPISGDSCGGYDMVTPVATTDYLLNTAEDGSGTNITTAGTVSTTFGANSAQVSIKNAGTVSGWATFFQLRGKGIHTFEPDVHIVKDSVSINAYGYFDRTLDQPYAGDISNSMVKAGTMLYFDRAPRRCLKSIKFIANRDSDSMYSFLTNDIGSLIDVSETVIGMTGAYIIHSISFTMEPPNIFWVTYGLIEHFSYLAETLTPLTLQVDPSYQEGINYGYLPQVVESDDRTYALWLNHTTVDYGDCFAFGGPFGNAGGIGLYLSGSTPVFQNSLFGTAGIWSAAGTAASNTWTHIVVTCDVKDSSANPIIYVNGSSKSVTESQSPGGGTAGEYGAEFVVGNASGILNWDYAWNGYIKDLRVYNRILTSGEVTTLYNGGTPNVNLVTTGLVFQGPACPKYQNSTSWGTVLVGDDGYNYLTENINGAAGAVVAPTMIEPPLP